MELIVERIASGDLTAEDQLANELRRRVFVMLVARLGDAESARELTQDVLMVVLGAIRNGRIENPGSIAAFAHGVARNLANNHIRSKAQAPILVELTDESAWADAEEEAEMADRRRALNAVIVELDKVDRRLLTMSIVEGYSAPEISERLGLSPEAVRARKSRALKRLAERLRKQMSQFRLVQPLH